MRDINFPFSKYVNTQGICDRLNQKHLKILRLCFFFWLVGFLVLLLFYLGFCLFVLVFCFIIILLHQKACKEVNLENRRKTMKNNNNHKNIMSDFVCLLNYHLSRYHSAALASTKIQGLWLFDSVVGAGQEQKLTKQALPHLLLHPPDL